MKKTNISNYNTYDVNELSKILDKLVVKETNTEYYLAGPWFTDKSNTLYEYVVKLFKRYGANCYIPKEHSYDSPYATYAANVSHILSCDVMIALIDEKDVGTAWEIGMAAALNKPIILLGIDETSFLSHTNIMLAFTGSCMVLNELTSYLEGKPVKYVYIDRDSWEGKE
jgi:nucleoside 2-deoxyribosyltransferase